MWILGLILNLGYESSLKTSKLFAASKFIWAVVRLIYPGGAKAQNRQLERQKTKNQKTKNPHEHSEDTINKNMLTNF